MANDSTPPGPDAGFAEFTEGWPDFVLALEQGWECIIDLANEVTAGTVAPESVIAMLTGSLAEDLQDVVVLCSHERRSGALRLLRTPFEKFLYASHISKNPEAAEDFLMYDAIHADALMEGVVKQYGYKMSEAGRAGLDELVRMARERFKPKKCKECGAREPRMWTKVTPEQMAKTANLEDVHVLAYRYATMMIHPSVRGITGQIQNTFKLPALLVMVHRITIETLQLQWKYFKNSTTVTGKAAEALQRLYAFAEDIRRMRTAEGE
jgi:hypothetical protein